MKNESATNDSQLTSFVNRIINGDCIEGMKKLPAESVDLIIADPPYNLSKGKPLRWNNSVKLNGMGGNWDKVIVDWDNMTFQNYWDFTQIWLNEAKRVLKPTGSIWVYGTYHNIGVTNVLFQKLGIEIINEIIWYKRNSFPNLAGRRFTASHETLLWGHTGGGRRRYTFNYQDTKEMDCKEDLLKKRGKQMRTVWDIPNNKKPEELRFGKHPTQKPLRICERIILATSRPNDLVLVPFCGSGSECLAAFKLGRRFIGFEIEKQYIELTNKRLDYEKQNKKQTRLSGD
ncbi:Modification methylase MjaV [Candidatus Gugararchaeum adminiculabundum]|nr:Modification methylase MjaV [Candidatus Gugararchaeum adminiculabundum]